MAGLGLRVSQGAGRSGSISCPHHDADLKRDSHVSDCPLPWGLGFRVMQAQARSDKKLRTTSPNPNMNKNPKPFALSPI